MTSSSVASVKENLISGVLQRIPDVARRDAIHDLIYDADGKSLPVARDVKDTGRVVYRWRQWTVREATLKAKTGEMKKCLIKSAHTRPRKESVAFEEAAQLLEEARFLHHVRGTGAAQELLGLVMPPLNAYPMDLGIAFEYTNCSTLVKSHSDIKDGKEKKIAPTEAFEYALMLVTSLRKVHQKSLLVNFISSGTIVLGKEGRTPFARFLHIGESSYRGGVKMADINLYTDEPEGLLAPEIHHGHKTSHASDVFMLAPCFKLLGDIGGGQEMYVLSSMVTCKNPDVRAGTTQLATVIRYLIRRELYFSKNVSNRSTLSESISEGLLNDSSLESSPLPSNTPSSDDRKPRGLTSPPRPVPRKPKRMLDAILDYISDKTSHLTFKTGQRIYQIKAPDTDDGFAYGFIDNGPFRRKQFGYFPLDYVTKIELSPPKSLQKFEDLSETQG